MSLEHKVTENRIGLLSKIGSYFRKSLASKIISYSLAGSLALGAGYSLLNNYGCGDEKIDIKCQKDSDCDALSGNYECISGICESKLCNEGETELCGTTNVGECKYGTKTCINNKWGDCIDAINSTSEICDEKDNNCDGNIDEGLYVDNDNDNYSAYSSCGGSKNDCNDSNPNISPGQYERRNNSTDDNCDGNINELLIEDFEGNITNLGDFASLNSKIPWVTPTNPNGWCGSFESRAWELTEFYKFSGTYGAESGRCLDDDNGWYAPSCIGTTIETTNGQMSFYHRFIQTYFCDFSFYIDGNRIAFLNDTGGNWQQFITNVSTPGQHSFEWCLEDCGFNPWDEGRARLDYIIFP